MLKRTIPLLVAIAIALAAAPAAWADHCVRCAFAQPSTECVYGTRVGRTECDVIDGLCQTSGDSCSHVSAAIALSSEYQVASVERIDEAPSPDQSLVAQLDVPQPATANDHR